MPAPAASSTTALNSNNISHDSLPLLLSSIPKDSEFPLNSFVITVLLVVGGEEISILVTTDSTVDSIKGILTQWAKPSRQILLYRKQQLRDGNATLQSLNIRKDSTLLLVVKVAPKKTLAMPLAFNTKYARGEVRFENKNRTATKLSSSPDVSIVFGDRNFSHGCIRFDVLVHSKGDEMWIGVTDKPSVLKTVTGGAIRRHSRIWAYCDGSRGKNFVCGGTTLSNCFPDEYIKGDAVGIELNWRDNCMRIFKNGTIQGTMRGLPVNCSLTPFCALDDTNDCVEIVRATKTS
eukprot:g2952.t1